MYLANSFSSFLLYFPFHFPAPHTPLFFLFISFFLSLPFPSAPIVHTIYVICTYVKLIRSEQIFIIIIMELYF